MSDTDLQNIQERLQNKFNEEADLLAWERKRAIVFWYDWKKSYEDIIDDLHLTCKWADVKILKVTSYFEAKYLIEHEDTTSHYLLYFPEDRAKPQENWLEDIRLYSAEFNADKLAIEINECKIEWFENLSLWEIYDKLLPYEDFFNNKQRKERFVRFYSWLTNNEKSSIDTIYLCMLASCVKAQNHDFQSILFPVFAWEVDWKNEAWNAIETSNLVWKFRDFAREYYWYITDEPSLKDLWYKILLWWMNYKAPGLKIWNDKKYFEFIFMVWDNKKVIGSRISTLRAYSSLEDWAKRIDFRDAYSKLAKEFVTNRKFWYELFVEDLEKASEIKNLCVLEEFDTYTIRYLTSLLQKDQYSKIEDMILYRKNTSWWYSNYQDEYDFILNCSHFEHALKNSKMREETINKMRESYTNEYYRVDQYYRKLLSSYSKMTSQVSKNSFKEILEYYNNAYAQWVETLNNRWCELLENEWCQSNWWNASMKKQWNFWNDYVLWNLKPKWKYEKILVIISDAFRYEAAKELAERLPLWNTCEYDITSVFGCLPSFTQLGMASLLPHEDLHFHNSEKEWTVDSWSQSTSWLENRNKILQAVEESSIAVKWDDFKDLKQEEQWAQLKDKKIVYVYHDIIDSSAKSNEDAIPLRAEDCIEELNRMMFMFSYSPFNFSRILVTADHGHLYQMKALEETDKSRRTTASQQDTSRFAIGKTDNLEKEKSDKSYNDLVVHLDYLWEKDLSVSTPWSDMRYKKPWWYSKFDHGWATLQELVVPVIEYSYKWKKQDLISQAKIAINTVPSIVTTNTIKLIVTQIEEVDGVKVIPWEYRIFIRKYTSKDIISREVIFQADKRSSQPSERQTEILIDLLPVAIAKDELCEIHIESTNTIKNNYEQDYPIKISIGIMDEFF